MISEKEADRMSELFQMFADSTRLRIMNALFVNELCVSDLSNLLEMTTLLYNVILMILLSYFYNQTGSFIPGMVGFASVNLTIMIISLL